MIIHYQHFRTVSPDNFSVLANGMTTENKAIYVYCGGDLCTLLIGQRHKPSDEHQQKTPIETKKKIKETDYLKRLMDIRTFCIEVQEACSSKIFHIRRPNRFTIASVISVSLREKLTASINP